LADLSTQLGLPSQVDIWEEGEARGYLPEQGLWHDIGFAAVWEAQSQFSALVLVALLAFASFWTTLIVMLAWSLLATMVYFYGRSRGLPDLLEISRPKKSARSRWLSRITATLVTGVKAWFAGIQPFLYSHACTPLLNSKASSRHMRAARYTTLGLGLTLFGVTAAHHILRKAGYSGSQVLHLGFVGSFLNVPYRILLGSIVINATFGLLHFARAMTVG
jgi:hypothetical protein